jgi:hypothetical protein
MAQQSSNDAYVHAERARVSGHAWGIQFGPRMRNSLSCGSR